MSLIPQLKKKQPAETMGKHGSLVNGHISNKDKNFLKRRNSSILGGKLIK